MNIDIYKSKAIPNAYLFIPKDKSIDELPKAVHSKLGGLTFFKSITFDINSPLIATDPKVAIKNIEENGYHIQGAKVSSDISEAGAAIGAGILTASLGAGPAGALIGAAVGYLLAHMAGEDDNAS